MSTSQDMSEPIEISVATLSIDENRVVHIVFKPTEKHDIEDAHQIVDSHNQLAQGKPCPVLADLRNIHVGADRPARKHYASETSAQFKTAMAMVVDSSLQRMFGNIFFLMNRPPYPTRIFNGMDEAAEWLKDYPG